MKIIVLKAEIFKLISMVQNIVEKRNTMPVLTNVLLSVSNDILTLYATDLEVSIKSTCKVNCLKDGQVVVNAKNLFNILKEFPDGEIHFKKLENNSLVIEQEKSYFNINGISPDVYPIFPSPETSQFTNFLSSTIKEMIEKTIYSVSTDESRYHLNGVLFESKEGSDSLNIRMVATDGHRLSLVDKNLTITSSGVFKEGIIIPRKGLNEIKKIVDSLDSNEIMGITVDGAQLIVKSLNTFLMIRLIEGKYPNYKQLLPKNLNIHAIIDKNKLISSLKRVSLASNQKSKGVVFSFSSGAVKIFSNSPDLGEAKEEIQVSYNKENLKIGFNSRYILEVLTSIRENEVKMSFKDKNSPVLLRPKGDEKYQCVVMPMRI